MAQSRVIFFGIAAIYLVGVVVQFFLAGLGAFGASSYDAHQGLGLALGVVALLLLALAIVGRVPRPLFLFTVLLVGLSVLQMVLANLDDVRELAALHVVNALVIFYVAQAIMQRSRRYLTEKIAA